MSGTSMVIVWPNSDGTFTLSQRIGTGHVEPSVDSSPPRVATVLQSASDVRRSPSDPIDARSDQLASLCVSRRLRNQSSRSLFRSVDAFLSPVSDPDTCRVLGFDCQHREHHLRVWNDEPGLLLPQRYYHPALGQRPVFPQSCQISRLGHVHGFHFGLHQSKWEWERERRRLIPPN